MAIPDYKSIMLPFLRILSDGREVKREEFTELLTEHFQLTEEERNELLPSGRQRKFNNRIGWALTYLKKALLIESIQRATYKITKRGLDALKENPTEITPEYLMRFEEFKKFIGATLGGDPSSQTTVTRTSETPEEILDNSYQQLRKELADELLNQVKNCTPKFIMTPKN